MNSDTSNRPWTQGDVWRATWAGFALVVLGCEVATAGVDPRLTPLKAVPAPVIIAAAEAFDDNYRAENLVQPAPAGGRHGDYASRGLRERTYVDFDFGHPMVVGGFRHVQRSTPDTIAGARLDFSETRDFSQLLATVEVPHVDEPGATTLAAFAPVKARYVRWQVTSVLSGRSPNVGGKSIEFFSAGEPVTSPRDIVIGASALQMIPRTPAGLVQPLQVSLGHPYAEAVDAILRIDGQDPRDVRLRFGSQSFEFRLPAAETERRVSASVEVDGVVVASNSLVIPPMRKRTVYILPHSHTDIGYTAVQTDIEEKQIQNLLKGIQEARRTADYPEGSRFVWNVEVLWAADLFLRRLPPDLGDEFVEAVRQGQVALNGMYLNELTGLCRPEELVRLFRYATELGTRTGVPVDSAMISDVPGYTWGTVTAMAQAGIRYFSVAPNYFDRIGTILREWENKPFWWVGPDGRSKVLVWIPFWGYAMSHVYGKGSTQLVADFCQGLEQRGYPYDIAYVRWAGHGDNAVPDAAICEFVREWNAGHAWPHFVISSTSEAFRAFEARYGRELPEVRGDWTPYWEDGAGSSAAETAMNRASSDRLAQAETLWAMLNPGQYPVRRFADAWYNVLLYSEHTWGAYCSISEPANPFTLDQWAIKQSYATAANLGSRQLLSDAAQSRVEHPDRPEGEPAPDSPAGRAGIDVFNTASWSRSGIALIPREHSEGARGVVDAEGKAMAVQRLASGELALDVHELPSFSGKRFFLTGQPADFPAGHLAVTEDTLENEQVRVRVSRETGGIVELRLKGVDINLVDASDGESINDYRYLIGDDTSRVERNGPVRIRIRDRGPLVASLWIESAAPGCHALKREVRLTAGSDHVELINMVDKKRLEASSYHSKEGKESLNFAFPFNVPDGGMRMDIPLGVFRPEADQMPSACKNWLTVGRWVDVANSDLGVTWVTLDAPLVQVGGLTATLLNSQTNPDVWRRRIERSQRLYSWAMNNHWGTNYRAYQEGPTVFRFVLRPHRGTTSAEASRFATGFSQPLLAVPARGAAPSGEPLLRVEPADVLVTGFKPSDDGRAWIVRLLGAGTSPSVATLHWSGGQPELWRTDTGERPLERVSAGGIEVPPLGLVTLRANRASL